MINAVAGAKAPPFWGSVNFSVNIFSEKVYAKVYIVKT